MKRLLLLRHAKSGWENPYLQDFDRPLSKRGIEDIKLMAHYIRAHDIGWDKCLCSPSNRTRETWSYIDTRDNSACFPEDLYLAGTARILNVVKTHGGKAGRVLVIGHNPGFHDLCITLAGKHHAEDIIEKFPTAALAILTCPIESWTDLKPGCAQLTTVIKPKDFKNTGSSETE